MGLAFVVTLFYALQRFERIFGTGRFELGYECIDLEVDVIVFGCRSNICICCFFVFSEVGFRRTHKCLAASVSNAVLAGVVGTAIFSIVKATKPILAQRLTIRPPLGHVHQILLAHLVDLFCNQKQLRCRLDRTGVQNPAHPVVLTVQMT